MSEKHEDPDRKKSVQSGEKLGKVILIIVVVLLLVYLAFGG